MTIAAAIFDLGGVVLDSPMDVIGAYEREHGIIEGSVNASVVASGSSGAWARHERGEIGRPEFLDLFAAELRARGLEVDPEELLRRVEAAFTLRQAMVRAIGIIRASGRSVAAITNNWDPFDPAGVPRLFDVFLESVTEGVRKPELEIYLRCLARLQVSPGEVVMLDDLGPNLRPARDLGMTTIKVVSERQALQDLEALLGISLSD